MKPIRAEGSLVSNRWWPRKEARMSDSVEYLRVQADRCIRMAKSYNPPSVSLMTLAADFLERARLARGSHNKSGGNNPRKRNRPRRDVN
jgi:hypothetical protein